MGDKPVVGCNRATASVSAERPSDDLARRTRQQDGARATGSAANADPNCCDGEAATIVEPMMFHDAATAASATRTVSA
jgi:hypothetical protein